VAPLLPTFFHFLTALAKMIHHCSWERCGNFISLWWFNPIVW